MNKKPSKYQEAWEMLKRDKTLVINLTASLHEDTAARERKFLRVRKAISARKLADAHFEYHHPELKIQVVSKDTDLMVMVLGFTTVMRRVRKLKL